MKFVGVYFPPACTQFEAFINYLQAAVAFMPNVHATVIFGDFNIDMLVPGIKQSALAAALPGFRNLIDKPTSDGGHLIDHVWTNVPGLVGGGVEAYWTDHQLAWVAHPPDTAG